MNELFPILSESYLSWDADLVAVEVVGLLASFAFFVGPVVYLYHGFVPHMLYVGIGGFIRATACLNFKKVSK